MLLSQFGETEEKQPSFLQDCSSLTDIGRLKTNVRKTLADFFLHLRQ